MCFIGLHFSISRSLVDAKRRSGAVGHDAALSAGVIRAVLLLLWDCFIHWNTMCFDIIKERIGPSHDHRLIVGHSLFLYPLYTVASNLLRLRLPGKLRNNALSRSRLTFLRPFLKSVAHAQLRILADQRFSSMGYSQHASQAIFLFFS